MQWADAVIGGGVFEQRRKGGGVSFHVFGDGDSWNGQIVDEKNTGFARASRLTPTELPMARIAVRSIRAGMRKPSGCG